MAPIFTPAQLAERWSVDAKTVRRLCISGKLRAFRVGDLWRITDEAVAEYEHGLAAPDPAQVTHRQAGVARAQRQDIPALDAPYIAVVPGPVPWRSSVIEAAPPAARRSGSARTKKAASQRH